MDIKEYINSGILELYVSGSLTASEMHEVEQNAVLYPEVKAELENIQKTMDEFARKHSVTPDPELKGRIWNAIQESEEKQPAKVVQMKSNFARYLAAASLILFVISTVAAGFFANKYKQAQDEIASLQSQNSKLAQQFADANTLYQKATFHIQFAGDPNTKKFVMNGTDAHPGMEAMVYWNQQTKQAMVAVDTLPMNPADKQYELWAIPKDGAPIPMGVFDANSKDMVQMKNVDTTVVAFAVTLEIRGGVASPTMSQMYVLGKVGS